MHPFRHVRDRKRRKANHRSVQRHLRSTWAGHYLDDAGCLIRRCARRSWRRWRCFHSRRRRTNRLGGRGALLGLANRRRDRLPSRGQAWLTCCLRHRRGVSCWRICRSSNHQGWRRGGRDDPIRHPVTGGKPCQQSDSYSTRNDERHAAIPSTRLLADRRESRRFKRRGGRLERQGRLKREGRPFRRCGYPQERRFRFNRRGRFWLDRPLFQMRTPDLGQRTIRAIVGSSFNASLYPYATRPKKLHSWSRWRTNKLSDTSGILPRR